MGSEATSQMAELNSRAWRQAAQMLRNIAEGLRSASSDLPPQFSFYARAKTTPEELDLAAHDCELIADTVDREAAQLAAPKPWNETAPGVPHAPYGHLAYPGDAGDESE